MPNANKQEGGGKALLFQLRGEHPGTAHPLPRDVFRIGSDEGNDLVLKDRDVQPQQVEISFNEDRFVLKGLSSEGSVFLNGEPFEESVLQKGDILYLFSDGYADQFGGPDNKKFKYRRLRHILLTISKYPLGDQQRILDETITSWMGDCEQIDDMMILGVRPF